MPPDLHSCLFEELERRVVERVIDMENHLDDSAVDDHLRAHETRGKGSVQGAVLDAGAVIGGLGDGVLFRVRTQAFIQPSAAACEAVAARAAPLTAILCATRRSVVPRRNNPAVANNDCSDFAFDAVGTHGGDLGDLHEVFVPAWPLVLAHCRQDPLVECLSSVSIRSIALNDSVAVRWGVPVAANPDDERSTLPPWLNTGGRDRRINDVVFVWLQAMEFLVSTQIETLR